MSKEIKVENDLEKRVASLEKNAKSVSYITRKMKDWMEVMMGADIDGDGQIGRAKRDSGKTVIGPMIALFLCGVISASAASSYIFNLSPSGAPYPFSVSTANITYAENLTVSNAVVLGGDVGVDGALTATTYEGVVAATMIAGAAAGATAAQPADVYGSATSVNGALASAQVICTNTTTMKDLDGDTFADYTLVHVWMSETSKGTASTNNIESLVLSGTEVVETTAAADYQQVTPANGIMTATITATASGTNYFNVAVGPRVTATEIIFLP